MLALIGNLSASSHYNFNGTGGVNAFGGGPTAATDAAANFRKLFFSDQRTGNGDIRSFPRWNMDSGLRKTVDITERTKMTFGAEAVNLFNHMEFADPGTDISNAKKFGVTSTQYSSPRYLNLNVRVDF